jgi:hypothetical protein
MMDRQREAYNDLGRELDYSMFGIILSVLWIAAGLTLVCFGVKQVFINITVAIGFVEFFISIYCAALAARRIGQIPLSALKLRDASKDEPWSELY